MNMDCKIVQTFENGELVCYASNSPEPAESLKIKKEEPSDVPYSNFSDNFNYSLRPIIPVVFKLSESSSLTPDLSVIGIKNIPSTCDVGDMAHTSGTKEASQCPGVPVSLAVTNPEAIDLNSCQVTFDVDSTGNEEQVMEEDKAEPNKTVTIVNVDEIVKRGRVPNKKYDSFVTNDTNNSKSRQNKPAKSTAVVPLQVCKQESKIISANKSEGSNDNSQFLNQLGLMKTGLKLDPLNVSNGTQVKTEKIESQCNDPHTHSKKGLKRKHSEPAVAKHHSHMVLSKKVKTTSVTNGELNGKSKPIKKEATIKKEVEKKGSKISKQTLDKFQSEEKVTCIAKNPNQMLYPVDMFSTMGSTVSGKRPKGMVVKTNPKPSTFPAEKHSSMSRYESSNYKSMGHETDNAILEKITTLQPVLVFKMAKPANPAKKIQETPVKTPVHIQGTSSTIKQEKIDCSHIKKEFDVKPKEEEKKKKVNAKSLHGIHISSKKKKTQKIDCSHIKTEFTMQPEEEENLNGKDFNEIPNSPKKKKVATIKLERIDCSHIKSEFAVAPEEKKKKVNENNLNRSPNSSKKKKETFPKLKIKLSFGGKMGTCMQLPTENSSFPTVLSSKRVKKPKIMEDFETPKPKTTRPKIKEEHETPKAKTPKNSLCNRSFNYSDYFDKPLPAGWNGLVVPRKSGATIGKLDTYIFSPQGKKLRSRPEIAAYVAKENITGVNLLDFQFSHNPYPRTPRQKHSVSTQTKPKSKQNSSKATKKKSTSATQTQEKTYKNIKILKEKILQGVQKQKSMALNEKLELTPTKSLHPPMSETNGSSPPLKSVILKKVGHEYQSKLVQKHKVALPAKIKTKQKSKLHIKKDSYKTEGHVKKRNIKNSMQCANMYKELLNGRHLSISLVKCDADLYKFNIPPVALKKEIEPSFGDLVPFKASTPVGEPDIPTSSITQEPILNWIPPKSPYNIIYESLYKQDWQLLIATIIMKHATASAGTPLVWTFFQQYPTIESIKQAPEQDLKDFFQMVNQPEKCASKIKSFVMEFEDKAWVAASELKSIGKYGNDAYRIFCTGEWRQVKPLDMDLLTYQGWLTQNAAQLGI